MRKIALFLAVALCAVSCIYPYDVEVEGVGGNLVVEGDIVVGSVSSFALSRSLPIGGKNLPKTNVYANVWVEAQDGTRYHADPVSVLGGEYTVDLSSADPSLEYRLRITLQENNREYCSSWAKPSGTCIIDDLRYNIDKSPSTDEVTGLSVKMSMHSEDDTQHFRYRYVETWEYSAYWQADSYYIPELSEDNPYGVVEKFSGGANTYYCWNTASSKGINLATTETMGVNRLDDYPLFRYDVSNNKISILYRLDLEVYPVSEESYRYLEHIRDMSNFDGSLFAPIPSEVRGNLRCMSDDDEIVYGYVGTSCPQKARLWIDNNVTRIYVRPREKNAEYEAVPQENWFMYYSKRWRPYYQDVMAGEVNWAPAVCVDCRTAGGNKNKPADWPNNHM